VGDLLVRRKLDEARWRLIRHHVLHHGVEACLTGLSLVFAVHLLALRFPVFRSLPAPVWLAVVIAPWLAVAAMALVRWRSLTAVAREVDARAATKNRFLTVLQLDRETPAFFTDAVKKEVAAFVSGFQLTRHLRLKNPGRKLLWLLVPLAALGCLELFRHRLATQRLPALTQACQIIEKARLAADHNAEKNPEFEKLVHELEVTLDRLPDSPEPLRDALRALAELEQKLSAASGAPALSADEAAALADALAGEHPQLAADLRSGNNQAAAEAVARLDPQALSKALEEAARHVQKSRLQELSRPDGGQAQKRLGAILQSSGAGDESGRRKFLSDLNDIKNGNSGASGETPGGKDGEAGQSPQGGEKSAPAQAENAPPGGAPGSEKDLGRGTDLAGQADPGRDLSAVEEFVPGTAGDGEALVEFFRATGSDDPKAAQAYRAAYQSALPAALDAVNREEVPSGSRILVRRYFEAIRPKE